jgi:hypothetical protein
VYGLSEYLIALQEAEKVRQESKARKTPFEKPSRSGRTALLRQAGTLTN